MKSPGLQFIPDWKATALAALLLPVVITLGFWQLDRAEEKRQLQSLFEQRQLEGPVPIETLSHSADLRYQPVALKGQYLPQKMFLLDNRIYRRRFGYEVLTPFKLADSDQLVLVNRGWLQGDISRRTLPGVELVEGVVELRGEISAPQKELLKLPGAELNNSWPRVIQTITVSELATEFSMPVFPYVVRLAENFPGSFQPNWVVVNVEPSKHTGYAVQWFAMAGMLVFIALMANTNIVVLFKQRNKKDL